MNVSTDRRTLHVLGSEQQVDGMLANIVRAGEGVSHWVLSRVLPPAGRMLPASLEWIHVPQTVAGDWEHRDGREVSGMDLSQTVQGLVEAFQPTGVCVYDGAGNGLLDRILAVVPESIPVENAGCREPLRVAYVLKKFPRYSETFVLREVLALESIGVKVQIFSLRPPLDGRFHASLARLGHTVEYLPEVGGSKGMNRVLASLPTDASTRALFGELFWECVDRERPELVRALGQAAHVAARIRELGMEHVHAHFATSASEVARLAARLASVTYSFTAHAKDIYSAEVDHRGLALKLRDAAFCVTVCEANREYLEDRHVEAQGKVRMLYNGVDFSERTSERVETKSEAPPLILSVGRFVEKKGFGLLIDALSELRDAGYAFRAEMLGDGELLDPMREKVRSLALSDAVHLPGARSSEQVREAMRRATVLACPCVVAANGDKDALPTVLLEALAEGLPCVATDVAGIPEILDRGRAGVIVEPDPAKLAAALRELCEDEQRRRTIAARGLERARDVFDLTENARRLARWFSTAGAVESTEVPAGRDVVA